MSGQSIHVRESRKARNPELFERRAVDELTQAEENSEVNRFVGWAIFSSGRNYEESKEEHKILQSMECRIGDVDDAYLSSYYDPNMAMLNTGGLTLVRKEFFQWGRNLVAKVRSSLTEELLTQDPINGFAKEKETIVKSKILLNHFTAICRRCSDKSDPKKLKEAAAVVYKGIAEKVVHSRFGSEFKKFKFKKIQAKDGIALRNGLKVTSARGAGTKRDKKRRRGEPEKREQKFGTSVGKQNTGGATITMERHGEPAESGRQTGKPTEPCSAVDGGETVSCASGFCTKQDESITKGGPEKLDTKTSTVNHKRKSKILVDLPCPTPEQSREARSKRREAINLKRRESRLRRQSELAIFKTSSNSASK